MKKLVFILGCFTIFCFGAKDVQAVETTALSENRVIYDLDQGGLQQFDVENDLGESYTITVEKEPQFLLAASSVSNGTYKITKERALQWKASYKIDVSNNKIIRAHSGSATAYYTGSFKSLLLKVDSSTQATYYLKRTLLGLESSINLRAKLSGSSIAVTY